MARTGTDKKPIEDQTKVIRRSDLIKTILTIVLIAMAGFQLFIFLQNKEQEKKEEEFMFSMKQKCREEGNKTYQEDEKEKGSGSLCVPQYSYNKELNTCLYYGCFIASDGKFMEKWVKDVFTNEEIIMIILLEGKPGTTICSECVSSIEEFNRQKEELFSQ